MNKLLPRLGLTSSWITNGTALCLLLSCSSSDEGASSHKLASHDAGQAGGEDVLDAANASSSSFAQPAGIPSGAKVRVVNAYLPLNGDPGPLDIYPHAWATKGDKPLLSVPYGEASDFFDPTVADEHGDMFLSFYWAGTTGDSESLITKTETLKGGEVITYLVTTGSNTQDGGRRFAGLQTFFNDSSVVPLGQDVSTAGKAALIVTSVGVDQVIANPADSSYFFSIGDGCAKAIGDDDFVLTAVGPGTSGTYLLDPGSYTGSIHEHANDNTDPPSCDGVPLIDNIAIDAVADQTAVLFIYASKDGTLRDMFLPLHD